MSWKEYAKRQEKNLLKVISNISIEMKNIKFLQKEIKNNNQKPSKSIDNLQKNKD